MSRAVVHVNLLLLLLLLRCNANSESHELRNWRRLCAASSVLVMSSNIMCAALLALLACAHQRHQADLARVGPLPQQEGLHGRHCVDHQSCLSPSYDITQREARTVGVGNCKRKATWHCSAAGGWAAGPSVSRETTLATPVEAEAVQPPRGLVSCSTAGQHAAQR
jgi:hypothetical protein